MGIRVSVLCLGAAVAMLLPRAAVGQGRPVELGLDMGLSLILFNDFRGFDLPNATTVSVPEPLLRVGFFASDIISIEPSLGFNLVSVGDGGGTEYDLSPSLGMLIHFSPDRTRSQVYAGPFLGVEVYDDGDSFSESQSQFNAGLGIGVKLPVADKLAVRLTAAFAHLFETESVPGSTVIAALVGFSFFTK